jgi:membrane protease subunit HflK
MAWNEPGNNNRDPWNQGSGGKGGLPPDLNELFRRLKTRLGAGKGAGKGLGGVPLLLAAALLVLVWLLFGFFKVDEQNRAVLTRLGAYARTEGPGLHWHVAMLEHVNMVNVGRSRQDTVQGTLLTRDQNLVDISLTVQFRVSAPEDNYFNVDSPDNTLHAAASSALQQVVAGHSIDEVVGKGDLSNSQAEIAAATRQLLQQILDGYHSGLQLTEASIKVTPPEAVVPAFADAIKAAEEQKSLHNDALAYASSRLPSARSEAARGITEAQAYRDQVIARAEGDVARFSAVLQEYRKSPQVTRKRLYLDTMSEIYANTPKLLVDTDKGNFSVPLQQLLQNSAEAATVAPAPGAAPGAAPPAAGNNGSDDNGARSRSREGR